MDSKRVRQQFKRIGRFRILVMGRANAGKTTILQQVCNTTNLPEIFDGEGNKVCIVGLNNPCQRGHHNIRDELVFQSNQDFVFHDSCGFEAGSEVEFERMKEFVMKCASTTKLNKRIHAIWFCIPMDMHERLITAVEERFFNQCDMGSVPVVVLLTKADTLNLLAIEKLKDKGYNMREAKERAGDLEKQLLIDLQEHVKDHLQQCTFKPKTYVSLERMNEEENHDQCKKLIMCTADALDDDSLQRLLISTQKINLTLNITYALERQV
ncbi:hypothetical protein ID866_6302 [Astraeus odoratus]|nr:hypothetical protein ID866_6302 [Astraeus odoratus]